MHDRVIDINPTMGKGRKKFWYFVSFSFLIWFLLLFVYYSGSNSQVPSPRDNSVDPIDTHESVAVMESENPNERVMENTGKTGEFTESSKYSDRTYDVIDNFFTGGDWDRFLSETSDSNQGSKEEDTLALTQYETQSINKVFGKVNNQGSGRGESPKENGVENPINSSAPTEESITEEFTTTQPSEKGGESVDESNPDVNSESCWGRYIYVHDIPSQFNEDLLKHCKSLSEWTNMCPFTSNVGLGPRVRNSERALFNSGWFETNQFMLEVIFHNRMKKYKCLTNDSALASAIFVPYYAGLDVARYLWHSNRMMRDHYSSRLVNWVRERPEWKRMWGRDHFMVAGRITWDFRRLTNGNSDWGNKLMLLPESRNMTMLTIESSPWNSNDFAIPYPTYFHPSRDKEVFEWQNRIRRVKRRYLFSFIGAPRPTITDSIRRDIMNQCQAARRKCRLLECTIGSNKCYQPVYVMKMFQSSTFCLQPPGDSYTRRSTFDAILAGCIPVFFHPGSAYVQYLWHFPRDYTKYSVFIPAARVKEEKASIERILSRIPKAKVVAMREQLIKMIPGVVYADPRSNLETLEDAFDITIDGVLERVEQTRKDIAEGKNFTDDFEEVSWKKISFGTVEKHEWDPFFKRH